MIAHHPHTFHFLHLTEYKRLVWERAFSSVSTALVGIFIPIYLLSLDYSISSIFLFYTLTGVFMFLLNPLGFLLVSKLGVNKAIVLGNLSYIIFLALLFSLPTSAAPLWILATFRGMYSAFYFPGFHASFIKSRTPLKTGQQISTISAITFALQGIAPIVGGIIGVFAGLNTLYAIAIGMIIIALTPILFSREEIKMPDFNPTKIPFKTSGRDLLADGFYGISLSIEHVIWPMLLSILVVSYAGIGALSSAVIVTSILTALYVGRREDKVGERRFINGGVVLGILNNIGRIFVSAPAGIFSVNILAGVSTAMLQNSFISRYYKNADNKNMLNYLFGMELAHAAMGALFFFVLFVLSHFLQLRDLLMLGLILSVPCFIGIKLIQSPKKRKQT